MFDIEEISKLFNLSWQVLVPWSIMGLGVLCFLVSIGIFHRKIKYGPIPISRPATPFARAALATFGVAAFAAGLFLFIFLVEYKPAFTETKVYGGNDAKQIFLDGDDVYVLKENGNIVRIVGTRSELVDDGTNTEQVEPAGGILYILKQAGDIWTYSTISRRLEKDPQRFSRMDDGTYTKQITSTGDTLYILKSNGVLWRYYTQPIEGNAGVSAGKFGIIDERADTQQISSSGAVLYILKVDGTIWQYAPTLNEKIENIHKAGDAISIKANGGTLYFIRNDGKTWQYKDQQIPILIEDSKMARAVDAFNGFVYILTDENKIFRRSPQTNRWDELEKAMANNTKLAAFGQDLFVIKQDKSVYRYSEFILER